LGKRKRKPILATIGAWSIELPDDWEPATLPDCLIISAPGHGALLRLTPFDGTKDLTAEEWAGAMEPGAACLGQRPTSIQIGAFRAFAGVYDVDNVSVRQWRLVSGRRGLDVDYRCPRLVATRDDVLVDAALGTIRLESHAT
jgi:hypothetical protein